MKTTKIQTAFVAVCGLLLLISGCSKNEEAPAPKASETQKSTVSVVDEVKKQAAGLKAGAETAAADAAKQVEAAKDSAAATVQAAIDKAKAFVAENKFEDASRSLQQLAGQTLTADQQKLVDGLKEQIQKAIATKATGEAATSVGNPLKK